MSEAPDPRGIVSIALEEDVGSGDLTASLIDANKISQARIISKESAILCGTPYAQEVFAQLDTQVMINWLANDGEPIQTDEIICEINGPARSILTGERTALNFLQTLSGTATLANQYSKAIADTGTQILDTRKTIPGLRMAQKYAVRCGGGQNHRMGLFDAVLIKENHIEAAGSITQAIRACSNIKSGTMIEIEVESLEQVQEAIHAGAKRLLLDNMSIDQLKQAVALAKGTVELEASGGVALDNVRQIANTGVNYISVGDLTKNVSAVDLSMLFV